ncbi:hypothetical protein NDI37_00975 [Funiculus sociatus GB2-A5]|uniref:Uncharacterized protein n=1 Tax=Funiculus sociatus GB2-A5 TaxID=2933946 RepID=A0ABV0JHX3_9CYAN|nr:MULTISPECIES: hypothetical protein [unclassified Trichocoleus]MBD1904542.1 hypothetical protein [Trichocoleus sp. FACHB-832]MBD2064473.1 hypothetical protein [Trichocoleus sp. FACHB-6]
MNEINKDEMRERLGNIDQIRDILFGSHVRDYSKRFEHLESELSNLDQEINQRIDRIKDALSLELQIAVDSLDKKIRTLSLNTQKDSADLRQHIDRTSQSISSTLRTLDDVVDTQTNAIRQDVSQTREKLQEDIRSLKKQVFEEMEKRFSSMTDVKLSKDDMAEIMFEFGMRLKGSNLVSDLSDASATSVTAELLLPESGNH